MPECSSESFISVKAQPNEELGSYIQEPLCACVHAHSFPLRDFSHTYFNIVHGGGGSVAMYDC